MRKSTAIKFIISIVALLLACLIYRFVFEMKISVSVVLIAVAAILPLMLMIKLPEKKK